MGPSLGVSTRRSVVNTLAILAIFASLACLILAVIIVNPNLAWAWKLGVKRQLQLLGLALSLMNQCLRTVSSKTFAIFEARFGGSILQNYDAILRNSALRSHTSWMWRITLLTFIALPLGLSIAYKDFVQGFTTRSFPRSGNYYGLTAPPGLMGNLDGIGPSYMVNATLPFISATYNDSVSPADVSMPLPFGFNGLLLSNTSAAFLDAPMPDHATKLQQNLTQDESYRLSARVTATIATLDESLNEHRDDDKYWQSLGISNMNDFGIHNDGYTFGMLFNSTGNDESWMCLALYQNFGSSLDGTSNFTRNAHKF